MTLDVREQIRERPAPLTLGDSIGEKRLSLRSEMKKEDQLDAEKSRKVDAGWNIPSCGEEKNMAGLEVLMSQMSLAQEKDSSSAVSGGAEVVRQLLGAALAHADSGEVEKLREAAAKKATAEFVQHLQSLLEKRTVYNEKQKKDDSKTADVTKQICAPATVQKSRETRTFEGNDKLKKKKDPIEELKDEADLCPRSPMRLQHNHRNNLPYQNTSRKHHSGGYVSTVAVSDPVAPTPQYHNHMDALSYFASSPPLRQVAETSDDPNEILQWYSVTELDKQVLMEMVEKILQSPYQKSSVESNDADLSVLPAPVIELNSSQENGSVNTFRHVDHLVPSNSPSKRDIIDELLPSPSNVDSASTAWGDYSDESGCYSLSPTSVLSSSPGGSHIPLSPDSGHFVPDISNEVSNLVPNMSSPGHFFDDNCPYTTSYNIDINITTKDARSFKDPCNISPASYSSISTPSPTMSPAVNSLSNGDLLEDFDMKLQIASNDILCNSLEDFDDSNFLLKLQNEPCSQSNDFSHTYIPNSTSATNNHGPAYATNIATTGTMPTQMSGNNNQNNAFQFNNHSNLHPLQKVMHQNLNFNCSSDLTKNVNNEFYDQSTFPSTVNDATNCLPAQPAPTFTVAGATYVESMPTTSNATNLPVGVLVPVMQARLVSPSASTLKQLKPKVEHSLRMETGKDRILSLMDKGKKAQAWVNVSANLKTINEKDKDGDTQLMILCTNTEVNDNSELEYIYALVEMLKKTPNALSAVNNQNQSPLYLAALYSNYINRAIMVRYIAETLIELGEDINYMSETGNSMLHEICLQGDQRYDVLVELLSLKNKAGLCYFNVNKYNHEGKTPLHLAALNHGVNGVSCLKSIRLLIAEGADITLLETQHSNTVLHLAISKSCAPNLLEALLSGPPIKNERVCRLINSNRDSPLHSAASRNDVPLEQQMKVIKLLLKHGAVKSLNTSGKFPIALVAEERRQEIKRVYESRRGSQGNIGLL